MKKRFMLAKEINLCSFDKAFTLAEVLITLGIIGVVAALTMPSLIAKYQEKQTVVKLKKVYSVLSQAYNSIKYEEGLPDEWYTDETRGSKEASKVIGTKFSKYIKATKICDGTTGCFANERYTKIDGTNAEIWNNTVYYKIKTADGISLLFYSYANDVEKLGDTYLEKIYGTILVDINGDNKPNSHGKDTFTFLITHQGIYPDGSSNQVGENMGFPNDCNTNACAGSYCESCAAWVIYNENMDYLHCNDLSWDGKTKCN